MILEAVTIKESGHHAWPWEGSGLIVVRAGGGGDGALGSGSVGGAKGGEASLVTIGDRNLAANGGDGGNGVMIGLPVSVDLDQRPAKGSPGESKVFFVSLPEGTQLHAYVGKGGKGGKTRNGAPGADGADGEVLLIPIAPQETRP